MPKEPTILTVRQVADKENVSTKSVYDWIKSKTITRHFVIGEGISAKIHFYSDYKRTEKPKKVK